MPEDPMQNAAKGAPADATSGAVPEKAVEIETPVSQRATVGNYCPTD